jgi:hypothetical protein
MKKEETVKSYDDDLKDLEKTKKNFLWVQEFSKKIIVAIFLVYILYCIVSILLLVYSAYTGAISGFETLTTEINETFRLIVGGYLIKAGLENITKIGGNYYDNVNKIKLQKMREDQGMVAIPVDDDFNNDTEINSFEEIDDQMN